MISRTFSTYFRTRPRDLTSLTLPNRTGTSQHISFILSITWKQHQATGGRGGGGEAAYNSTTGGAIDKNCINSLEA
jgi:hypothetical protein